VCAQQLDVAGAPGAESKVVPDGQPAHTTALDQHLIDELFGGDGGETPVEVLDEHAVDAAGAQRLELVAQIRDPRRRLIGREELARVRLERHHRREQAACPRGLHDLGQQRPMPAVNAIEVSDRQRTGLPVGGTGNASDDVHRQRRKGRDYRQRNARAIPEILDFSGA
jgi:hypothetical protein